MISEILILGILLTSFVCVVCINVNECCCGICDDENDYEEIK